MKMMNVSMMYSNGRGGSYIQPSGKGCVRSKACLKEVCCGMHAGTLERVLRYPDGRERRIRYPCPDGDDVQRPRDSSSGLWEGRKKRGVVVVDDDYSGNFVQTEEEEEGKLELEKKKKSIGDNAAAEVKHVLESRSPLEMLRYLTSAEYKEEQEREWQAVKDSFDVHHGCPWPIPKQVYTIVLQQQDGPGQLHTLRTRISEQGVETELNKLLGFDKKKKDDGDSAVIRCSSLVDGVVVFEDEDRADEYGQIVQGLKNGHIVHIAEHDSHDLFRNVQEAKGVVVVIRRDVQVPNMQQLAAVLRNPDSDLDERMNG